MNSTAPCVAADAHPHPRSLDGAPDAHQHPRSLDSASDAHQHPRLPKDGGEFRVRIARRWFTAAWCENVATGEAFLGVKLAGPDFVPVAEATIEAWKALSVEPSDSLSCGASNAPPRSAPSGRLAERESEGANEREIIRRVEAMVKAIRYMPDIEGRFLMAGQRVNWPSYTHDADDIKAQRENHANRDEALARQRHKITPRDLAEMDETWGWFCQLDPLSQKERRYLVRGRRLPLSDTQLLIWRVALGASFHTLAKKKGEHHETVRRRYGRAIDRLAAIAGL